MVLEQRRLKLHKFLCELIGSKNCYYSPPSGIHMKYPCIVYDLSSPDVIHADNIPYLTSLQWTITVIDENPDSKISDLFFNMRECRFDRKFTADDLNHFVYSLYF